MYESNKFITIAEAARAVLDSQIYPIRYWNKSTPFHWQKMDVIGNMTIGEYIGYEPLSQQDLQEMVKLTVSNSNLKNPYYIFKIIEAMVDISIEDQNYNPRKYDVVSATQDTFTYG